MVAGFAQIVINIFITILEFITWRITALSVELECKKRGINKVEDKFNRVFCGKNPTKEQAAIIANVGLEFILGLRHILDSNEVQIVHKETIYSILGED